ncbi:MAG: WecB/TagA/CpsF family glycosyltransferase [Desulfobacterales bacterium]
MAVNPEKVMAARKMPFLEKMFEHAALLIPDGIGIVIGMRWIHGAKAERLAGADLMQRLCEESADKGHKIFIYGSRESVNKKAVKILEKRYSGINIVGRSNGYVSQAQMTGLVEKINQSGADILFVALGSPRQEEWIDRHLAKLNVKVCQGIGGTLDTIAGEVKRAPVLFQKMNLEWFYRLVVDPKRIQRQYLLPVFMMKMILNGRSNMQA